MQRAMGADDSIRPRCSAFSPRPYHNETEKIAEGPSCRIFLDSPETAASSFPQSGMVNAVHEHKKFKIVIIVLIGWATEWAVQEALESPDGP